MKNSFKIINTGRSSLDISIAMLAYNHEKFIGEAIESVLMQKTNYKYQINIAEDFSTDKTRKIVLDYKKKYPDKIKLILQDKNVGVNQNNIDLLLNLEGKYIAALEGDDYWTDPLKLQKQVDFLEGNKEYAGCFHYTQTIKENGELGRMFGKNNNVLDFDAENTFSTIALLHTSSFVFLRSALALPAWFSKVVSGDMALFSIISAKGKLRCLPEIMSVYRKHEGGITNTLNILNNYHSQRIELMNYLNEFHNYKYQKAANAVIDYHKKALGANSINIGIYKKIIQKIKKLING